MSARHCPVQAGTLEKLRLWGVGATQSPTDRLHGCERRAVTAGNAIVVSDNWLPRAAGDHSRDMTHR